MKRKQQHKWSTKQPRCAASQKKSKTAINQLSFQNWRNERVGLICFWFLAERAALWLLKCWVMAGARPSAASELHSILSFKRIPFHLSWLHYWIAPAKKSSWMRWDWRKEVNWRGIEWDEVKRLTGVKIYNPLRRLINEWNSLNGGGSQQINFTSPFNSSNQK